MGFVQIFGPKHLLSKFIFISSKSYIKNKKLAMGNYVMFTNIYTQIGLYWLI